MATSKLQQYLQTAGVRYDQQNEVSVPSTTQDTQQYSLPVSLRDGRSQQAVRLYTIP
jgi:hypothetical protein